HNPSGGYKIFRKADTMPNSSNTTNVYNQTACGIDFETGSNLLVSIYSLVFLVGFMANSATICFIVHQVKLKNDFAVYLLSLSISDLLYLLTIPLWIKYITNYHIWKLGHISCYVAGFVFYSNMYVSIILLCCISIDRYLAVAYSLESQGIRTRKNAAMVSIFIVFIVFAIHFLLEIQAKKEVTTCYEDYPMESHIAKFNYFRFVSGFFLPLLILIFSYQKLFQKIKGASLTNKQKNKIKLLSVAVIVIFLICFAPYHIILLLRTIIYSLDPEKSCDFEKAVNFYFSLFLAVSGLNSAMDPILYILVTDSVKNDYKKLLSSLRAYCSPQLTSVRSFPEA
uniref:G protein-coupled receptor 184 n=1 Tax=Latimeria chalumnae TaxID=7897 RepID=H3AJ12_LATCH